MSSKSVDRMLWVEVAVGSFVLAVFACLVYFTIIISGERLFSEEYPMQVAFTDVMGLRKGDNVVARGMPVGTVESLVFRDTNVVVTCALDQPVAMHEGYRARIVSTSLLGGRHLELDEGDPSAPEVKTAILAGDNPIDLMNEASAVVRDIRMALDEGGIIANIRMAVSNLATVSERLVAGEGTIGKLLADDTVYTDIREIAANLKGVSEKLKADGGTIGKLLNDDAVYNDLKSMTASLREVSERVASGKGTLGKLVQDEQVYTDLKSIAGDLKVVASRLAEGKGTLGQLLSDDDTVYQDLKAAVASLKTVAVDVEAGKGTLGKIMRDDALYDDVRGALGDVRAAVDDFRENTPVVTFTSILFGAF